MSTKRLSKTVIEGGRANKWERRQSHIDQRAADHLYCKKMIADPELADDELEPVIKPVYKDFRDKLRPMYRWLDAQVGRPWDQVCAEVFQKFDTRTTAGRHITFDHLLSEVVATNSGYDDRGRIMDPNIPIILNKNAFRSWSYASYYVDQSGIFRARADHNRRHHYEHPSLEDYISAEKWLNNRIVGLKDNQLYWFAATQGIWHASWDANINNLPSAFLTYYILDNGPYSLLKAGDYRTDIIGPSTWMTHGDHWELVEAPFSFRQRSALTSEEIKQFCSFKKRLQEQILAFGKGR